MCAGWSSPYRCVHENMSHFVGCILQGLKSCAMFVPSLAVYSKSVNLFYFFTVFAGVIFQWRKIPVCQFDQGFFFA